SGGGGAGGGRLWGGGWGAGGRAGGGGAGGGPPPPPGRTRHWLANYYPVRVREGPPLGVGVVVTEITERKQMEEALRRRAEELAEAARHKDDFLAILGHELRNPLASLRNALQVLHPPGTEPSAPSARALERVERQVQHPVRLVEALLDVSRLGRGKLSLRREVVDVTGVAQRAVQTCRPALEARGHTLTVDLPAAPVYVEADPLRLEQVFTNL